MPGIFSVPSASPNSPSGLIPFFNIGTGKTEWRQNTFGSAGTPTGGPANSVGWSNGSAPTGNSEVFGSKIGPIAAPNPYADLSAVYPNLSGTNNQVSGDISAQLRGQLSPGTLASIQDAAARFGVSSGMPGFNPGSLTGDRYLRDIAGASEAQVQRGVQNYNATIPTFSSTQTLNPSLQAEIAATNATNAAAPDPTAANQYAQQLFQKYLDELKGPAGGTTGVSNNSQLPTVNSNPLGKPWWQMATNTSGPGWGGEGLLIDQFHHIQGI